MRGLAAEEDDGEDGEDGDEGGDDDDQFDHTGRLSGFNDHLNTRRRLYEKSRKYSVDSASSDPVREGDKHQVGSPYPYPAHDQSMMSPGKKRTTAAAAAAVAIAAAGGGGGGGGVGAGSVQNSIRSSASVQSGSSGNLKDAVGRGGEGRNTDPLPQVLLRLQLDLR
jgi:hypothetical protein